jgi:hypothetical protein
MLKERFRCFFEIYYVEEYMEKYNIKHLINVKIVYYTPRISEIVK